MSRIAASIGIAILLYFIVGFGGCLVRIVSNSGGWIENDTPSSVWTSYTTEAVIAFFMVLGVGVLSAVREYVQPTLSAETNRSVSLGIKSALIAFLIAGIFFFGIAGFSSETKTESKTGRYYTVVEPGGISLEGNHYSKNATIEVLEETENAYCLKLLSGRKCYPTPFVLQKTGKTNVDNILRHGNVDTKTVQSKQVITSPFSAFFGNLFVSVLLALGVGIATVFVSRYISMESAAKNEPIFELNSSNQDKNQSGRTKEEKLMRDRMIKILTILKNTEATWVTGFKAEDDGSFELITPYSEHDHRTWLVYEPTGDGEIIRVRIQHLFGFLEMKDAYSHEELIVSTNQLYDLLKENNPQYRGSSAHLGLSFRDGNYFVFLLATPIFLAKWADAEIADVLEMQVMDIVTSLMFEPPAPIVQFSKQRATEMGI